MAEKRTAAPMGGVPDKTSVQADGTHMAVLLRQIFRYDPERPAVFQLENRLGECGSPQGIFSATGTYRVKAQRSEDVPGAHRPGIVIAAQATGGIAVFRPQDFPDGVLRFPGLSGIVIQLNIRVICCAVVKKMHCPVGIIG